ncbi:beta-galactoside-binding lectin-like isoform X1 [Anguilla anguilla]|uniref:beta-galactoside-binding lectin-like isoform X1 n=1 Tax=Anguilla anguilla TaxID=7936 RepID=UPI0015AF0875|nr:beta-galactoside-binding lectin-like isoform X1 [Anguilla anguilla]
MRLGLKSGRDVQSSRRKTTWQLAQADHRNRPQRRDEAVVIKNMSFKAGQTMTITGMVNPNATNFAINIGHEQDIALHVNPRFDAHGDQRTVVCNSYQGGKWCEEVRDSSFPFQLGKEFKVIITFNAQEFQVSLPDGSVVRFPNRLGDTKYRHMKFEGDTRIQAIEIK